MTRPHLAQLSLQSSCPHAPCLSSQLKKKHNLYLHRPDSTLASEPAGLAAHLEAHAVLPVLYASSWLLTCFASDFPLSFAARVLDLVISDSWAAPMMKVRRQAQPCRDRRGCLCCCQRCRRASPLRASGCGRHPQPLRTPTAGDDGHGGNSGVHTPGRAAVAKGKQ